MAIETQCRNCSARLRTADETAGEPIRCPACSTLNLAPSEQAECCYFCGDELTGEAFVNFERRFLDRLEATVEQPADQEDEETDWAESPDILPTCDACQDSIEENRIELEAMRMRRNSGRGTWLALAVGLIVLGFVLALMQMGN